MEIKINCETKDHLPLKSLEIFQGGLKKRKDEDYRRIKASILKHGMSAPVFVWKDGGHNWVIDGTGRTETLRGMESEGEAIPELPVVYVGAKDAAEAKEILLKISSSFGKVSQKGFEEFIKGLEIDLEDLGLNVFPPGDIKEELGIMPDAPKDAVTRRGDAYQIETHRLVCGDCRDAETYRLLMGEELADLVFTDPPYGVDIAEKNRHMNAFKRSAYSMEEDIEGDAEDDGEGLRELLNAAFSMMKERMKDCASYYVTAPAGPNNEIFLAALREAGMPVKTQLVWAKKQTFSGGRSDYAYQHEPILYGWKKTHKFHGMGKWQTSLWHYQKQLHNKLHPTMKPPELVKNAIENSMEPVKSKGCLEPLEKAEAAVLNSSVKNDIILDPFAGSGSALIAAHDCKRRARLIEIDPHYCDVIVMRAMQAYPEIKVYRERNGEAFEVGAGEFSIETG